MDEENTDKKTPKTLPPSLSATHESIMIPYGFGMYANAAVKFRLWGFKMYFP